MLSLLQEKKTQIERKLEEQVKVIIEPMLGDTLKTYIHVWSVCGNISVRIEVEPVKRVSHSSFSIHWDYRRPGIQIWNVQTWNGIITELPQITEVYRTVMRIVDNLEELNIAFAAIDFDELERVAKEIKDAEANEAKRKEEEAAELFKKTVAEIEIGASYSKGWGAHYKVREVTRTRVFFEEPHNAISVKEFAKNIINGSIIKQKVGE